ncbi:MAG: hypothetical protein HYZ57_20875 [Acidobacteria bacterium]|nr:hypothetical protein [Acidobacteriota bacterium]
MVDRGFFITLRAIRRQLAAMPNELYLVRLIHQQTALEPAVATAAGKLLALAYGGDCASTDWRHLGRLAGFTNQKPARRTPGGYSPWVKVVDTKLGLATRAADLLHSARALASSPPDMPSSANSTSQDQDAAPLGIASSAATEIYRGCIQRWRIRERYPQPDWSIVDLWGARHLLSQRWAPAQVQEILRLASPQFPRRHGDPDDYLRRTIARAVSPSLRPPVCSDHA